MFEPTQHGGTVNPARAGMIPEDGEDDMTFIGKPRASGDDPEWLDERGESYE